MSHTTMDAAPSHPALTLVCATRSTVQVFHSRSWLGACLPVLGEFEPLGLKLTASNQAPLAVGYNQAIDEADPDELLVFVHDDVHIDDWMLAHRLREALATFDVVGVAGNRRRQSGQWTWHLQPTTDTPSGVPDWRGAVPDTGFLSGAVAHGGATERNISAYGPSPTPACLLDGVFLAARAGLLQASGVRFDAQLAFHFYDLDFCRSAEAAGLRLGTWPIAITHQSAGGSMHSESWLAARALYVQKWGA